MKIVLISTYELGHQPFGLASPARWLKNAGFDVICQDLSIHSLIESPVQAADFIGFYLPMHTATKIAIKAAEKVKRLNPQAYICFYGLYATVNQDYLKRIGADFILGGEFEADLVELVTNLERNGRNGLPFAKLSLAKQDFQIPDRSELPDLGAYAKLIDGDAHKIAGYTEASRGCKHLCRHCPIVPVYNGKFRIVSSGIVLADVRQQVAAGAVHITFGDPDFFNGPRHAIDIIDSLHREFPQLTYDVTIKVEHLLKHQILLPKLKETGCLFVTSAVESIDDLELEIYDKNHTKDDFILVVNLFKEHGLVLQPTFVTFSPWTTLTKYQELLDLIYDLNLVDNIPSIQYCIRLLIPNGSKLLEVPLVNDHVKEFDAAGLFYPWRHASPEVDVLYRNVRQIVEEAEKLNESRRVVFSKILSVVNELGAFENRRSYDHLTTQAFKTVPHLSEPWYCCAEPTEIQLSSVI